MKTYLNIERRKRCGLRIEIDRRRYSGGRCLGFFCCRLIGSNGPKTPSPAQLSEMVFLNFLRIPGIDYACLHIAWQAVTTTLFLLGSYPLKIVLKLQHRASSLPLFLSFSSVCSSYIQIQKNLQIYSLLTLADGGGGGGGPNLSQLKKI
jgi:hypothetical protein